MHISPLHYKQVLSHLGLGKSCPVANRVRSALAVNKARRVSATVNWRETFIGSSKFCVCECLQATLRTSMHLRRIMGGPSVYVCNRKIGQPYGSKIHHYQHSNCKNQQTFTLGEGKHFYSSLVSFLIT